jgi:hypothetical protein
MKSTLLAMVAVVSVAACAASPAQKAPPSQAEVAALRADVERVCAPIRERREIASIAAKLFPPPQATSYTLMQLTDARRPSEQEKSEILNVDRIYAECWRAFDRLLMRQTPPGGEYIVTQRRTALTLLLAKLYEGTITYGEYAKKVTEIHEQAAAAFNRFVSQVNANIALTHAQSQALAQQESAVLMNLGVELMRRPAAPAFNPIINTRCVRSGTVVNCTSY